MKHHTRLALAGLLSAVALTAAACGGADGADRGEAGRDDSGAGEAETTGMRGMDHGSGGMPSGMLMEDSRYSDRRFIDAMVPHHRGAVEMAEVAMENAEHQEIKNLARNIVSTQEVEIEELRDIKQEEFGTSKVSMRMDAGQMEGMGMMAEPENLANREPFDRAFIDAMVPHHRSAIEMAEVAVDRSENPRIRDLAGEIIRAQEREISQMRAWREEWYPGR